MDDKDLDEDVKRIECADSRKRDTYGRHKGALLEGGPQEPSYEGMTAAKERVAREEYQMLRKKWRDQTRSNRLQAQKTTNFNDGDFTGNLCPTLRLMSDVCVTHLQRGHSFPDRDLVLLRASEEANFLWHQLHCEEERQSPATLHWSRVQNFCIAYCKEWMDSHKM